MAADEQADMQENTDVYARNADSDKKTVISQAEQEHLTYLAVYEKYEEYSKKRFTYRKAGLVIIILSVIVFILLMLSQAMKVIALLLWIAIILSCVAVMITADHRYDTYREMLGLKDELDDGYEDDEEDGEPPEK